MVRFSGGCALLLLAAITSGCGTLASGIPTPAALFAPTLVVPPRPAPTQPIDDALLLGLDSFGRVTAGAWSVADRGGAYTLTGPNADFAVAPGVGTIRNPAPGDVRAASLLDVQTRDVDVRVRLETDRLAAGGDQFVLVILRRTADQDYYVGRVRFDRDQSAWLQAGRMVDGTTTWLGGETSVPEYVHGAGIRLWIRAQANGVSPSTVRLKAWPSAQTEPAEWSYSTVDGEPALQVAGSVTLETGTSDQITNAPVIFGFSDLRISTDALPTEAPTLIPVTTPTPLLASATTVPTAVATITPAPTTIPPALAAWNKLMPRLDVVWATDTAASLALLDEYQTQFPDFQPAHEKLYAVLIARAGELVEEDQPEAADAVLERAQQLLPGRNEAQAAALALTPTPLPATPTPIPSLPRAPVVRAPTPRPAAPVVPAAPAPPAAPTKAPFVPPAGR